MVGGAGATVFVMASRGELPDPWPVFAVLAWAAVLWAAWCAFVQPRVFTDSRPVGARAGVTDLGSVVGMLVLIEVGGGLLGDAGRDGLLPALIVLAVGLHFLPFAAAFDTAMFSVLSAIAVLGATGLGFGWGWDARAA